MSKIKKPEESFCPAWMMTFGDCMSLLVTFFVMLIAFSSFEEEKLASLIGSFKGALGITAMPMDIMIKDYMHSEQIRGQFVEPKWLSVEELSVVMPNLQMALKRFGSPSIGEDRYLAVTMLEEGLAFVLSVKPLFKPGSSGLLPGNENMLQEIGNFLDALANEVRVIGVVHETAPVFSSDFNTPWGLAISRALAVQDGLIKECRLSGDRFAIGARMESARPLAKNEEEHDVSNGLSWRKRVVTPSPQAEVARFRDERIEIIVLGRRDFSEISPEEIIVKDKWE